MSSSDIQVQRLGDEPTPKPKPELSALGLHGEYLPSADGYDSNLLILLHGLGDTSKPYYNMAKSLRLPQTAILAVRGLDQIPLLPEEAYQWFESFDLMTGNILSRPNPSVALSRLLPLLHHLTSTCKWPAKALHLFGFQQGGSLAIELAVAYSRLSPMPPALGSVVTISGPPMSFPTLSHKIQIPCLGWERPNDRQLEARVLNRLFHHVEWFENKPSTKEGMPSSPDEWRPIMKFWSENLRRLQPWELGVGDEQIYEVKGA